MVQSESGRDDRIYGSQIFLVHCSSDKGAGTSICEVPALFQGTLRLSEVGPQIVQPSLLNMKAGFQHVGKYVQRSPDF